MQKSKKVKGTGQRIIFTGPNGIGNYRPKRVCSPQFVEMGPWSPVATSNLSYLWRAAPHAPPPLAKQGFVGEVGWCWQYSSALNDSTLRSGMQIRKSEIRLEAEDRAKNKFLDIEDKIVFPMTASTIVLTDQLTPNQQSPLKTDTGSDNTNSSSNTM
ncbi:protein SPMIP2 [Stigmatopora argus]